MARHPAQPTTPWTTPQAIALTILLRHVPPDNWMEWLTTLGGLQFELEAIKTQCGVLQQSLSREDTT